MVNLLIPRKIINEVDDTNLAYWTKQLTGISDKLSLQTDYPRLPTNLQQTGIVNLTLHGNCFNELTRISEEYGATICTILLSAFHTLLYRYTNQEDLVLGVRITNYDTALNARLPESREDVLPLRTDLSGNPSFSELLERICKSVSEANGHRNTPWANLEDIRACTTGLCKEVFSQVIFSFNHKPGEGIGEVTTSCNLYAKEAQVNSFDLWLSLDNSSAEITGNLKYNSNLFGQDTIHQIVEHFKILLDSIIVNPRERISCLQMLSEAELYKLTVEWNDTYASYPHTKCLHELFTAQAILHPTAIAVELHERSRVTGDAFKAARHLNFDELNCRSNQLANYLQDNGVGPEVVVGIYMKRSFEMIVAIMGILKAGGAYLPMDPGHPKSRLDFILKDSGISLLLTQHQLAHTLPTHETDLLCVNTEWNKIARYSDEAPTTEATPENLAYLIYTSGSTGVPKGTLITHRGVVNYLSWCIKVYDVAKGEGAPINSSLAFDATVTSLLSPLLAGKKLLLLPEEDEIEALSEVLSTNRNFSLVKITPAHLAVLNNLLVLENLREHSNTLVIGGDSLNGESLRLLREHAPRMRIINEYGPTETVVGCIVYEISAHSPFSGNMPIGRPIANTQIYILDSNLQPVPIGAAGELYIGGHGVARGYHNRPDLTTERFIPNPFSSDIDSRLYKSGDMVRFLKDGNILFLARNDHQVKIRGYRIELREIELALMQFPNVQQTIVLVREDTPNDKRLVAYIVLSSKTRIDTNEIRNFLSSRLPAYMLPSAFILLDSLPLNVNGKIDKTALPLPGHTRPELMNEYMRSPTDLEADLTGFFEYVLQFKNVRIRDNLFELGINSLQVYWVFSQIKKRTGIQLPLSILFQTPTIEKLAAYVQTKELNAPWSSLVPIQPKGTNPPLFCIHGGGGTVLFYQPLSQHLGEDQPMYGLQPLGLDGKQNFHNSVEQMATHYIREIQTIDPEGPYLLAGYCFGGIIAFEMAQQLICAGYKVALLVTLNGVSPTYDESPNLSQSNINIVKKSVNKISKRNAAVVKFNRQYFDGLSITEKSIYLLTKLKNKSINILKYKVVRKLMTGYLKGVYLCCLNYGIKCPESLRKQYFYATNSEMVKKYKPKSYPGVLTVIRSPGVYADPHIGWSEFVAGGIKTIDIPGKHKDRRQILNEPFVRLTANEVKKQISQCQKG